MFPWLQPGNLSKNSGIACLADRKIRDYKINEFLKFLKLLHNDSKGASFSWLSASVVTSLSSSGQQEEEEAQETLSP